MSGKALSNECVAEVPTKRLNHAFLKYDMYTEQGMDVLPSTIF